MDIANVITMNFPGNHWRLIGNEYKDLEWFPDSKDPKPTLEELTVLYEKYGDQYTKAPDPDEQPTFTAEQVAAFESATSIAGIKAALREMLGLPKP